MRKAILRTPFRSVLASFFQKYLEEKRACGYRYEKRDFYLHVFDRFLYQEGLRRAHLPKELVDRWIARRTHERPATQQVRISLIRQFGLFLRRQGRSAHVPDGFLMERCSRDFVPRILDHEEVSKLIAAADSLSVQLQSPLRHWVMPEIFRLLCGCGLRCGEVLRLKVSDVDLEKGVLTIRQGKFRRDRFVPLTPTQTLRLRTYAERVGAREPDAFFFQAPRQRAYHKSSIYGIFRQLLRKAGIGHGGRGQGPRLHDLRHGFAVHRLTEWYQKGDDLGAKLPLLSIYMGHMGMAGTQRYLRLTAQIFPDLVRRSEEAFGHVIPRRTR